MLDLQKLPVFQTWFHDRIAVQHRECGGGFQGPHKAFSRKRLLAELLGLSRTHHKTSAMGVVGEIEVHRFSAEAA